MGCAGLRCGVPRAAWAPLPKPARNSIQLHPNVADTIVPTSYMEMDTVKHQLILVSSYEHVTFSIVVTSIIQC
jgi:hypothetical protein